MKAIVYHNYGSPDVLKCEEIERLGLGYTPFGVTKVSETAAIYDLTPIRVVFKPGVELQMKQVIPVLIDREKKLVMFAVTTPVSGLGTGTYDRIETDEFKLASVQMDITSKANLVTIRLK